MDPDVANCAKRSIKGYVQRHLEMGSNMGSHGIQYGRGHTSSTTTRSMFEERRDKPYQYSNEEVFILVYQALIMCEMVDPSTSRSTQVVCAA